MPSSPVPSGSAGGVGEEAVAVEAAAFAVGVALPGGAAAAIAAHAARVRDASASLNLTAIVDPEAMRVRHVVDSLMPLAVWPEAVRCEGEAIDLGSGAGYPGLPLALARACGRVTLVDATRKKVDFLTGVIEAVQATDVAAARWGRAEELAGRQAPVERVWVRAVGPLAVLVELGLGLLAPGGVLVAWKGPEAAGDEADAAARACRALGGEVLGARTYALPDGAGARAVYAYRRGAEPLPRGVPRSPAVIRRRPLGAG